MNHNAKTDDLMAHVQSLLNQAFQRGYDAGVQAVLAAAQGIALKDDGNINALAKMGGGTTGIVFPHHHPNKLNTISANNMLRQRAPRGLAEIFVRRCLEKAGRNGLTIEGIKATAETPEEQMISMGTIGHKLREGEDQGLYQKFGDKWFLA